MKRALIFISLFALLLPTAAHAQARGGLTNVWASWASVLNGIATSFTPPYNSRDVQIINSSAQPICVDLKNMPITGDAGLCRDSFATRFYLDGGDSLQLYDYVASGVSVWSLGNAASPVSVIITY